MSRKVLWNRKFESELTRTKKPTIKGQREELDILQKVLKAFRGALTFLMEIPCIFIEQFYPFFIFFLSEKTVDPDTDLFKTRYQQLVDLNRLRIKYAVFHLI
jgi:hypothetical protein